MAAQRLGWSDIEARVLQLDRIIDGEFAENEVRKDFTVSERVAILGAIETKTVGNPEFSNQQNFANINQAAKQAGLGNKETARQATKVVEHGIPNLVAKVDAGEISISGGSVIAGLPEDEQEEVVVLPPREAVAEGKRRAHVSHNSGNNEWYTPAELIEAV